MESYYDSVTHTYCFEKYRLNRNYWWIFTGRKFSVNWEHINLFTTFFFNFSPSSHCSLLFVAVALRTIVGLSTAQHKGASFGWGHHLQGLRENLHSSRLFLSLCSAIAAAANWRIFWIIIHVFFSPSLLLNRIIFWRRSIMCAATNRVALFSTSWWMQAGLGLPLSFLFPMCNLATNN